jgi:hypothetical protein
MRLFAVGCSFTKYQWPTYADIVGRSVPHFENWGISGIGNRAIFERIIELDVKNSLTADDVVIVQWSGIHRWDVHLPAYKGWQGKGAIFTGTDHDSNYNAEWIQKFWDERSYIMHTCHFVLAAKAYLESKGCRWVFTSLNNILDDVNRYGELDNYLTALKKIEWLPAMNEWLEQGNYQKAQFFSQTNIYGVIGSVFRTEFFDQHPTPIAHYDYAKQYLKPLLGIELDRQFAEQAEEIVASTDEFEKLGKKFRMNLKW